MESLGPIALVHTLGSYLLLTFLIIHLYLITTGHTITSNLEAMITGWETVEDEDVKDIVEEVIDETRQRIKPLHQDSESEEELRRLVVEALNEKEQAERDDTSEVPELSHHEH
jgi:hypothetical protein